MEILKVAALIVFTVLFCSLEAESSDWQLTIFNKDKIETICAKDEASCNSAIAAIRNKKWPIAEPSSEMLCEVHVGCFLEQSNCIKGYNCK